MEQLGPNQTENSFAGFSIISLAAGILALMSCVSPPTQLFFGSVAIILAYLSKNRKPFTKPALLGIIMGILAILCSFLMFFNFLFVLRMMDDPVYAALVNDILAQYQDMLNTIHTQPPMTTP